MRVAYHKPVGQIVEALLVCDHLTDWMHYEDIRHSGYGLRRRLTFLLNVLALLFFFGVSDGARARVRLRCDDIARLRRRSLVT